MFFKSSLNYFNQFFFFIYKQIRNFYLNSKIYNKKISKISKKNLEYKPSPNLLDCLIKYKEKKITDNTEKKAIKKKPLTTKKK